MQADGRARATQFKQEFQTRRSDSISIEARYLALFSNDTYYQFDDIGADETLEAISGTLTKMPGLLVVAFIDMRGDDIAIASTTLSISSTPTRSYNLLLVH